MNRHRRGDVAPSFGAKRAAGGGRGRTFAWGRAHRCCGGGWHGLTSICWSSLGVHGRRSRRPTAGNATVTSGAITHTCMWASGVRHGDTATAGRRVTATPCAWPQLGLCVLAAGRRLGKTVTLAVECVGGVRFVEVARVRSRKSSFNIKYSTRKMYRAETRHRIPNRLSMAQSRLRSALGPARALPRVLVSSPRARAVVVGPAPATGE